jgi:hypothetical protein
MVKSDADALVMKSRPEAILATVPLQSSVGGGLQTLYFVVFYIRLCPSRDRDWNHFYRWF